MNRISFQAACLGAIVLLSACDNGGDSAPGGTAQGNSNDPVDNNSAIVAYDFSPLATMLDNTAPIYQNNVYVSFNNTDEELFNYASSGVDENTVFKMASASKWISGAVILSLAEENYFSLDDRIGDYLPIFDTQGKGDFTIRDAFSMSSGLFDTTRPHTDPTLSLEESVDVIALNTPFIFSPPGSGIAYDGKQMQIIGRIAEVVTGKSWRLIAQQQLFDKCGMDQTQYDVFGMLNPAVAGGISTTAHDYLVFLKMIMDGGLCGSTQVLTQNSIEEMFTNQTNNAPVVESPWPSDHPDFPYGNDDLRYGFGAWVLAQNPESGVVEELTSPGAWGAFPWLDRSRNMYGVIFTYVSLFDGGFQSTLDSQLELLKELRYIIDSSLDCAQQTRCTNITASGAPQAILSNG